MRVTALISFIAAIVSLATASISYYNSWNNTGKINKVEERIETIVIQPKHEKTPVCWDDNRTSPGSALEMEKRIAVLEKKIKELNR